jgi:hypothetical protein
LSSDIDSVILILDLLRAALNGKMFLDHETRDEEYVRQVVDVLLYGGLQMGAELSRGPQRRRS